jgi:hypothetical protein
MKILIPFKQLTKLGQAKNNDLSSIAGVLWGFDMFLEVQQYLKARWWFLQTGKQMKCLMYWLGGRQIRGNIQYYQGLPIDLYAIPGVSAEVERVFSRSVPSSRICWL